MPQQNNSESQFSNGPDFTSSLGLNREAPEFNPPAGPSLMQQMPPGVMPMPQLPQAMRHGAPPANNFNLVGAPPAAFAGPNGSRPSSMTLVGPQGQLPPMFGGTSNANSLFQHGAPLPPNHMFAAGGMPQMPPQMSAQHASKQMPHSQFAQLPLAASAFGSGGGPYSSPSSRHLGPSLRNNSSDLMAHGSNSELHHLAMSSQLPMHLAAAAMSNALPTQQMGLNSGLPMGAPQMPNHQNALSSMMPPMDSVAPQFALPPGVPSGTMFAGQTPPGMGMTPLSGGPLKGMVGQSAAHLMPGTQFVSNQLTPPGFPHHTLQQHPPYMQPPGAPSFH